MSVKLEAPELTVEENEVYQVLLRSAAPLPSNALLELLPGLSLATLSTHLNALLQKHHIDPVSGNGAVSFRARAPDEVARYANMDANERIIYGHIKQAGNKGIWIKDLKQKSNIHTKNVQDAVKSMEKKNIIKSVKSVKNPIKKVYMLYELDPSEEVSGGTWYTDNEFDGEFINKLSDYLYRVIAKDSFPPGETRSIYPPNFSRYPTLLTLTTRLELSKITTQALPDSSIEEILDRLVYDGKIERIDTSDERQYRAVRDRGGGSAWTGVPCGMCPVYDQCDDQGPITPIKCEYLDKWLSY